MLMPRAQLERSRTTSVSADLPPVIKRCALSLRQRIQAPVFPIYIEPRSDGYRYCLNIKNQLLATYHTAPGAARREATAENQVEEATLLPRLRLP